MTTVLSGPVALIFIIAGFVGARLSLEQIRDTIVSARDLRHKGDAKRQLDYATRTAQKARAPD
jgi:hypothetical protein